MARAAPGVVPASWIPQVPENNQLPKAVGVYDRPKVRRSTRLMIIVGVVMLAVAFVVVILLR